MRLEFTLNDAPVQADADPDMPLLWLLRDAFGLTSVKFGCGVGACGACTVHLDGGAVRACTVLAGDCRGRRITTLEGLGGEASLHPVQQAWIDVQVPQCGYCQPGMIMAAAALLTETPRPTEAEVDAAMTNLCRCGTYPRVRRAIARVATESEG
ncbi:(2Fe-2S)-binding protein [Frigidibacter oleivorans]|uniref:(2Fe-2S)-binding protein n=1 Tax=Frigidibacter oleivorans TaxID=2487129 RepID=UPI000F8E1D2E|nr:(2Fe-2S)-binding protein [Frigidibacter oleivorans]